MKNAVVNMQHILYPLVNSVHSMKILLWQSQAFVWSRTEHMYIS